MIGPLRWVRNKEPFPSAQISHLPCQRFFGQKFSTSSLNSLGPVSFTLTVNPTPETCTHQFTTCGDTNATTISALLAEINNLKETVNRSETNLKKMQNQMYWNEKMNVVAELAHIYKERIASYTLDFPARGKPELKWKDLVVHDEKSLEDSLLKEACESYGDIDPEIITDVDYFMEIHPVPQTVRPMDSTFFAEAACMKARKFKIEMATLIRRWRVGCSL